MECFFVYNPTLSKSESDEQEKILFYTPRLTDLDTQKNYVGLVQGIVNFTKDFSDKPANSLHAQKCRYAFHEAEPDFWIALVIRNPEKGDGPQFEYLEEEIEDQVLHALLLDTWRTFTFFNGTLQSIIEKSGAEVLRKQLSLFFKYYIPTIPFSQIRYFADIYGFRFFPVDRTTYLGIQYLSNLVEAEFPNLHSLTIMFNQLLIWSGLDQEDMRVLYTINQEKNSKFLYGYLARCKEGEELKKNQMVTNTATVGDPKRHGVYLTGPLRRGIRAETAPLVFLKERREQPCRLVAFKLRGLSLFWMLDDLTFDDDAQALKQEQTLTMGEMNLLHPIGVLRQQARENFYKRLQIFLQPHVTKLVQDLERHQERQQTQVEQFRFLYFNHQNLALKSCLRPPGKKLSSETCRTLRDMHADFQRAPWEISEICAKCEDGWLLGKKSHTAQRELYLLVDLLQAPHLRDLSVEMSKLEKAYFNNIFFY